MIWTKKLLKLGTPQKKGGLLFFNFSYWQFKYRVCLPFGERKNKKGQALTEALITLPLASACFVLCLWLFHSYTQQLWMDHQLYQSLICLAKGENKSHCKNKMDQKIKSFLWVGELKNIKLDNKNGKWSGAFIWKTSFLKIPFKKTLKKEDLL